MESQRKLLLHNLTEAIKKQQGEIAYILAYKENNSAQYLRLKRHIEALQVAKADPYKIEVTKQQCKIIDDIQHNLLQQLHPKLDELFNQVASETEGGIEYNAALQHVVLFDLIFGYREPSSVMDCSRDQYRYQFAARVREEQYEKKQQARIEKMKIAKEKVQLPRNHSLLNKESYPELQQTMWTHLDKVVSIYQEKFLKDKLNISQLTGLIDHYFLFIFLKMLKQSKVVFDTKKPSSNPFIVQVIDDCLMYIQNKYNITLSITSDDIKKKFFSTINETTLPLELLYKNFTEEDVIEWEWYLNEYFFTPRKTSVDAIRRIVMNKSKENEKKMALWWEMINPLYHLAKEKKAKILQTIEILENHKADNNLIEDRLNQLKESLVKAEEDMQKSVVFEEDPIKWKTQESIIKIQQQYLRFYQVPVQYRKLFSITFSRINHFYQVKANLVKKANKNNERILDQFIDSDQTTEDILHYINQLITTKYVSTYFDEKWNKKQEEKFQVVQSFCNGTRKIQNSIKPKEMTTWQIYLDF